MLHLPEPILFHPLKHHLLYIRQFISEHMHASKADITAALKTIGSSQLDLYTGSLTPDQIAGETLLSLHQKGLLTSKAFKEFLTEGQTDYQIISLSDKTDWILRWGTRHNRYVHLHPARYTQNTLRVKANSLKTAIAVHILASDRQEKLSLALLNKARKEYLGLSEITSLNLSRSISNLVLLLDEH